MNLAVDSGHSSGIDEHGRIIKFRPVPIMLYQPEEDQDVQVLANLLDFGRRRSGNGFRQWWNLRMVIEVVPGEGEFREDDNTGAFFGCLATAI
jgi:hypothetical protein